MVVGNPDKFEGVPLTASERWKSLNYQAVDLLVRGGKLRVSVFGSYLVHLFIDSVLTQSSRVRVNN